MGRLSYGLIDTVHLFVAPVVVGGGKPALPRGVRIELDLEATRRFANGMVHLQYAVRGGTDSLVR
jgi:dihydrofolate reductase